MRVVLRLAGTAMVFAVAVMSPAASETPALVIEVLDYADSTAGVLGVAQHHVTRVYGVAGIRLLWHDGAIPLPSSSGPVSISVVILSDLMAQRKAALETIPDSVLATAAPPPARRVWVFMSRIVNIAARQELSPGLVLGHVIAHETAHALADLEHSEAGVMNGVLRLKADTFEGFTTGQSQQLRAAVRPNRDAREPLLSASARNPSRRRP